MARRKSGSRSTTGRSKGSSRRSRSVSGARGKWFAGNIHLALLYKLSLVLLLLFLSRILFFLFNLRYFSDLGFQEAVYLFFAGLRFDISALLIINAPFVLMYVMPFRFRYNRLYLSIANGYFYFINTIALMANFVDTIYFRFTLKRITFDIFRYLGVGGDFDKLIPQFLKDFWYVGIAWIAFVAFFIYVSRKISVVQSKGGSRGANLRFFILNSMLALIILAISVIGIRGGLQLRPIGLVTAGQYTSAKNIPLVLNTPFSIARTIDNETLQTRTWFRSEKELAGIYTPLHPGSKAGFRSMNVVIIIMESFSREHIGIVNRHLENGRYQGFTPFLDSLIRQGVYFDAFANGKTSIQGIPAILSGIPSLMNESFIQSSYAVGKFSSIAGELKKKGYTTAFFHGGTNGTMGFDSYTKMVGFDRYFGRSEFNNEKEYDGKWGIRDEAFFQFTAEQLKGFREPFMAAYFSLSSHHPYYVPPKYANIFRKGKLEIQQSIMYADFSLARFFYSIRHEPWFDNTLFVITSDHTSEAYYPYYQSNVGQYSIPLLFYQPGVKEARMEKPVAQQTDIMPTVLSYLGYDNQYLAFGSDLFDPSAPKFSVHYISGLYGMIKDGYYIEFDGNRCTSLFHLEQDPLLKNNIAGKNKKVEDPLLLFLKAYVQQYNNRAIENRMIIE